MKTKLTTLWLRCIVLALLALPTLVQAQFNFTTNNGAISITGYTGSGGAVVIPAMTNGYPVTSIGDSAFQDTSLTSVTIPNSVTSIADFAFIDCIYLTSVTIGNGVTSIGEEAFADNVLTSVTIPNSVTNIGEGAFGFGTSLTSIKVDAANPAYSSLGGVLFDKAQVTLLEFPGGRGGSYTIPNSVTSIGGEAFEDCIYLTSVTIPSSITSIGVEAFELCSDLKSVIIGNRVTSIGDSAFSGCSGLTSVTMGNSVISIGEEAFVYCSGLTSITIPHSVTSIGLNAFYGCSGLTSVTIGNSVTSIGEGAFYGCSGLTSVTIGNSVTSIGSYAFADCNSLTGVYFQGNSPTPTNDSTVFYGFFAGEPDAATVYYLPGTTGWGAMFDGQPTAPWFLPNPLILNGEPSFGVGANGFGFTISWATNVSVVVEAATNLANPVWLPVSTNTLTGGTSYFSDPQWTNYPERFYRAVGAYTVGGTLTGLPAGDTVTLQDNGSDNLTLSTNGAFTFPTALPNGHAYSVSVSGTSGGTSILTAIYSPVTANHSGTISGANVTNVAVQCKPIYTGNLDEDMYNAAVADGTANGGVPGVMLTENGGPFRVTASVYALNSDAVAEIYAGRCVFTHVVGSNSCSSTTFPSGTEVIQFGTVLECGFGPFGY